MAEIKSTMDPDNALNTAAHNRAIGRGFKKIAAAFRSIAAQGQGETADDFRYAAAQADRVVQQPSDDAAGGWGLAVGFRLEESCPG